MKKTLLKSMLVAGMMAVSAGAWAQEDVTSYIVNAGFEECTPSEGNLTTSKDGLGIDYADAGWTFMYDQQAETWSMSAVFAYGSDGQINGAPIPATDNAGNSGNALGVSVGWGHSFYYQSSNAVTLPIGHYELKVYAYNANTGAQQFKSLLGFVPTEGTAFLSTKTSFTSGEWVTDVVTFDITEPTEGKFQIGGQAVSGGSGSNAKVFFDNISLTVTDPLKASKEALQKEIETTEAIAKLYKDVESNALNTAIATAKSYLDSTDGEAIKSAIEALKQAVKDYRESLLYTFDGTVYIIDSESGKFIAAGHDWGTRGIVNEIGLDFICTANKEDKTITLDSKVYEKEKHFLGSDLYTDAAAYGWKFEYIGFGFYITNGTQYINIDQNDNLIMSDTPREWIVVTTEGVMEQRLEEMAEATESNPVDATFFIKANNFNRNDSRNAEAWTVSEDCTNKNLSGGNNLNNCAESYHSTFTISQTIEGIPAGIYEMTAQGFYRQDKEEKEEDGNKVETEIVENAPVFFINDATTALAPREGSEDNMTKASESFTNGLYTCNPIRFILQDGEKLTVGVKGTAKWQWVIFDNFRLSYLGTVSTGISETQNVNAMHTNAIYNLQGQRVSQGQKGLYIRDGKKFIVR